MLFPGGADRTVNQKKKSRAENGKRHFHFLHRPGQWLTQAGMLVAVLIGCFFLESVGFHAYQNTENVFFGNRNHFSKIALTFDDGPDPHATAEILDILKEYGIKATFFVIGEEAERYPELIAREAAEGHEIGSHTYTHLYMKGKGAAQIREEWEKTQKVIESNTDSRVCLLRPPGGIYSREIMRLAEKMNYTLVLWTIDTRDWSGCSSEKITAEVLENAECGDIILMHDAGGKHTPEALRQLIPVMLERGFRFVTVSELLSSN